MDQQTKSRKMLWAVLTISLGFNIGFITAFVLRSFDHRPPPRPERPAEPGHPPFHEALNLTSQEQAAMRTSREKLFQDMEEIKRKAIAEQKRLAELVAAAEPDKEAISVQLDKAGSIQQQAQQRLVEHLLEQKSLLSPEQQERYNEFIRQHLLRHLLGPPPPGREGGPPPGPPPGHEGRPPPRHGDGHRPPPRHGPDHRPGPPRQ